jgi:hypothetical protein
LKPCVRLGASGQFVLPTLLMKAVQNVHNGLERPQPFLANDISENNVLLCASINTNVDYKMCAYIGNKWNV